MSAKLRTVSHDGGLFSFAIPADWSHRIEEDGTQVFWSERDGSGTLRVTSLTATKDAAPDANPQLELLRARAPTTLREDGVAWIHYRREEEEEGQPTVMFWWEFSHFIPPRNARLAFFSFTVFAHEEHEPGTVAQLEVLRVLTSNLKFGPLQPFEE